MARLLEGTIFDRPPHCERCEKPESECLCPPLPKPEPTRTPPAKQTLRLAVEKRGKGKVMTVVRGLAADNDPHELLSKLKSTLGAGGALEDGELLIQGKQLDRLREVLQGMGFKVKG